MCTLVVLHQVHAALPLVVAANRDERHDRASTPPAPVARDPLALAGLDAVAGGTWMGANTAGFFVGITNQRSFDGPRPHLRSRGQLALEVLRRGSYAAAMDHLATVDARETNDFNLFFGEPGRLAVAYGRAARGAALEVVPLGPGVHVLANDRLGSREFPRATRAEALARAALPLPWPALGGALESLLADTEVPPLAEVPEPPPGTGFTRALLQALQAVCIRTPAYGTRSGTVLAVDGHGLLEYRFADGPPCERPFTTVWSRAG